MKKRPEPDAVSMTPMIDIVFQMIIFFVCTVDLDKEKFQKEITIPETPNSEEQIENDTRTIFVQVNRDGKILLGSALYTAPQLLGVLQQAVNRYDQNIPVVIHADGKTRHASVSQVMDIVARSGIWNISFSGIVEHGSEE